MNQIRGFIGTLWYHIKAVPLSIIAFVVVACILICREPDDNPYIDGGDDADRD